MDSPLAILTPEHAAPAVVESSYVRMLASPQFARAETQRKLLQYLWERRHDTVSEYAIAVDALGRSSNFDPNSDASVRVQISRLRRKLKDYYAETREIEYLVIPTGTHQLMIVEPVAEGPVLDLVLEVPPIDPLPSSRTPWLRRHATSLLVALCLLLAAALAVTSYLLVQQKAEQKAMSPISAEKPNAFWRSFLASDAPVRIVLPTPVFFNFRDHPWLKMRSTKVNAFDQLANDPDFQMLLSKLGPRGLEQSYTVTWDTLAAIEIARYLDRVGEGRRVSFEVTRDSSLLALEQANVIVLGTDNTLYPMHAYTDSMNFSMIPGEERVINAHPLSGEPEAYHRQIQSPERHVEPSIIAVLPGRAPGLKVLLLESRDTSGMVSLLASNAGSQAVDTMWKAHNSPQFFEMVTMTEMEGTRPLRSWPVTMHAYTKTPPI